MTISRSANILHSCPRVNFNLYFWVPLDVFSKQEGLYGFSSPGNINSKVFCCTQGLVEINHKSKNQLTQQFIFFPKSLYKGLKVCLNKHKLFQVTFSICLLMYHSPRTIIKRLQLQLVFCKVTEFLWSIGLGNYHLKRCNLFSSNTCYKNCI